MATIQKRISRGYAYWSIVESRRVNGKPRPVILEYLGSTEKLLKRLSTQEEISIKSYSHGDTSALLNIVEELNMVDIINKYVPANTSGEKPVRDGLTVGASLLLAAIGRASHPTSKMAWYDWCKSTSMEYCLKSKLKNLNSQHFWDQMNFLPEEKIPLVEEEIVRRLVEKYNLTPETLLFDTSNFFTFIASDNDHCDLPQRGRNKQKRSDLRQIGLALLVSKKNQFPLFHKTYEGNKNDITIFKETLNDLIHRLKAIFTKVTDVTLVFDKGNNSKKNFGSLNESKELHYVVGLVPSYFKKLIRKANKHFETCSIEGEEVPIYRIKKQIWKIKLTCVVSISSQLKEGQLRGINQHLEKKYKVLEDFKQELENPKRKKKWIKEQITKRLQEIIHGQFIEEILKFNILTLKDKALSFTYYIDKKAFKKLEKEILGRKIIATNRHNWSSAEIILAYRGLSKVEYAFKNLKNPVHLAIRPQFHWTDQKIKVHFLICIIGYLLVVAAYVKAREAGYKRNISNLIEDLGRIRLACCLRGRREIKYQLEEIPEELHKIANVLGITDDNICSNLKFSVYS